MHNDNEGFNATYVGADIVNVEGMFGRWWGYERERRYDINHSRGNRHLSSRAHSSSPRAAAGFSSEGIRPNPQGITTRHINIAYNMCNLSISNHKKNRKSLRLYIIRRTRSRIQGLRAFSFNTDHY